MEKGRKFRYARNVLAVTAAKALVVTYLLIQFHPEQHRVASIVGLVVFMAAAVATLVFDYFYRGTLFDRRFARKRRELAEAKAILEHEHEKRQQARRLIVS